MSSASSDSSSSSSSSSAKTVDSDSRSVVEKNNDAASSPKIVEKSRKRGADALSSSTSANAGEAKEGSNEIGEEAPAAKRAKMGHTLFVGQLPFYATKEMIIEHFESFGVLGATVRLLTNKKTGKSKGIAFLEVTSDKQMATALRAHHTLLGNRPINVERTVGGGGNGETRKQKIKSLKQLQGSAVLKEVRALVDEAVAGSDGAIKREDIDDRLVEALCSFPRKTAKLILGEVAKSDFASVRNRSAWIMGFIKRYRDKMNAKEDFDDSQAGKYEDRKRDRRKFKGGRRGGRGRGGGHSNRNHSAKGHSGGWRNKF